MSLAAATHKAVRDALVLGSESGLTAYIAGRVYDRVPLNITPAYPYIEIGTIEIVDDANTCSNSSEIHLTLSVWSNTVGSIQAKEIGGLIRGMLAPDDGGINLVIPGYHICVAAFDVEVYRPGPDPVLTEGVLSFTLLVDPAD